MSHELAARLEARAVDMEKSAKDWQAGSVYQQALPNHQVAKAFESFAERDTQHAADLRAAAQAVRAMDFLHEYMAHVTEWTTGGFVVETRKHGVPRWLTKTTRKTPSEAIEAAMKAVGYLPLPAPPEDAR